MLQHTLIWQESASSLQTPLIFHNTIIRFTLHICPCETQSLTSSGSNNYINEYVICWLMELCLHLFCCETQWDTCEICYTARSHRGRQWNKWLRWSCHLLLATWVCIPHSSSAATQSRLHLPLFQSLTRSLSQPAASALVFFLLSSLSQACLSFSGFRYPPVITHSLVLPSPFFPSPGLLISLRHLLQAPPLVQSIPLHFYLCFYLLQFPCP